MGKRNLVGTDYHFDSLSFWYFTIVNYKIIVSLLPFLIPISKFVNYFVIEGFNPSFPCYWRLKVFAPPNQVTTKKFILKPILICIAVQAEEKRKWIIRSLSPLHDFSKSLSYSIE